MLSDKTAIAGIGATEFSKNSGRSELRLASEAVCSALADAGIEASQVDGLCTMGADNTSEVEIARAIGAGELTFFRGYPLGAAVPALWCSRLRWRSPADSLRQWSAIGP